MLKTIKISEASKNDLHKICKEHNLNIGEAVEAMIAYFKKTKENPTAPSDFVDEFKRLKNQLIGFIKTQEQEKLTPMVERLNAYLQSIDELHKQLSFIPKYFSKDGAYWQRFSENLDKKNFVTEGDFSKLIDALKEKFAKDYKIREEFQAFKGKTIDVWNNFKSEYKQNLVGSNFNELVKKYDKIFSLLCT